MNAYKIFSFADKEREAPPKSCRSYFPCGCV